VAGFFIPAGESRTPILLIGSEGKIHSLRSRLFRLEGHNGAHRKRWRLWISSADQPDLYSGRGGDLLSEAEILQRWPGDEHMLIAGVADDDDPGDDPPVEEWGTA